VLFYHFFCITFSNTLSNTFSNTSNLNISLFSLAVIFLLVFAIRETFKRRNNVIQLLSIFKSPLNAAYYTLITNPKMDEKSKALVAQELEQLSAFFRFALQPSAWCDQNPVKTFWHT